MITREEVYSVIDGERDYQDAKWGDAPSKGIHPVTDYVLYMEHYLTEARKALTMSAGDEAVLAALDNIRKVAGLTVACMEQNGAVRRTS